MQRRDVLKFLTSAAALSTVPAEFFVSLQEARADGSPSSGLRTFNPHQNTTVVTLSEWIIPETDTPGAKGAKVNEFMDLLLTEWFSASDTRQFLADLAQVDGESRKQFGTDFIACNASQQKELLEQFDRGAMEFAHTHTSPTAKGHATPEPVNFFYTFKRLTLVGYYTSEIGFKQELHKTIIPPGHAGCAPMPEVHA